MYTPLLLLRLAIAIIFIYHSLPKLKNAKKLSGGIGLSKRTVFVIGLVEFFSSLGLVLGIFIQFFAFLLACVMLGAIYMKIRKWHVPFSAHDKIGWEYDFILLVVNITILLSV